MGLRHAAPPEHSRKDPPPCLYARLRGPRFLFGTLYAPAQALLFGLDFNGMITWIIAGLPWDAIHGVSNFLVGVLIAPLISVIRLAEKGSR